MGREETVRIYSTLGGAVRETWVSGRRMQPHTAGVARQGRWAWALTGIQTTLANPHLQAVAPRQDNGQILPE